MTTLEVLFEPLNGSPVAKHFKQKPLGLFYRIQTPIVVTLVMGEAEDIGVEVGWQILRVGDKDIIGLSFEGANRALWDGAKNLTETLIMRHHPIDTVSIANMILWWKPPVPSQAVEILQSVGYSALGPTRWRDVTQPSISLQLGRQHELAASEGGVAQDWYDIYGRLYNGVYTENWLWVVPRRQMHLYWFLHDPVRLELGRAYDQHFKTECFAAPGQPPSTSVKLGAWLATLARVINSCQLSPALTAVVMCFLEAPQMGETSKALHQGQAYSSDQILEDAYVLLDDGDELPIHPPAGSEDGSKLQFASLRRVEQFSGHQIVKEVI